MSTNINRSVLLCKDNSASVLIITIWLRFDYSINIDNVDVYTVENGQITKAEIFTADVESENRFWGDN